MNNSNITINEFLGLKGKKLPKSQLSAIESSDKIIKVRDNILKKVKSVQWAATFKELVQKIEDILSISIVDIMIMAWDKSKVLLKYLDNTKYHPEDTILVSLAEHTIKSEHHPYIEMVLNGKSVGSINFDIDIEIVLEGATLKIQNGKIKEIMTGSCKGKGSIMCEGYEIVEKEMKSISLPGTIDLGDGIAIAP